ncbi:hypothetical protein DFH08DRAFT_1028920 [Mycena albidolilacea]|uniref:Uncharacterized protein n=1 Tax=Mycena albidolilacea TaxID=1033008 RepID=A0AAD6ZJ15_9AGAR|nr:hypothetical protein DFH08DRAFT_1028920 [Mycena albidolilacea]
MALRRFEQENQYSMPSNPKAEGEHISSDSEPDEENPRPPARRVPRRVGDYSDSDSIHSYDYDAEDLIDIKQEYIDTPLLSGDDELEYFDEPSPAPGLRPLEEDEIDRETTRTKIPGIDHSRNDGSHTSPARSLPVPVQSLLTTPAPATTPVPPSAQMTDGITEDLSAPTVEVQSADSSMAMLPRLRKRTKRNLELKCGICDEEVTEAERESAAQCTRAGCELILQLFSLTSSPLLTHPSSVP